MSITDELRKYVTNNSLHCICDYLAIADRIDAEHQKAEDDMWHKGYNDCHTDLMDGNEVIAADLERAGWVRLPVDADRKTIHIGEAMEGDDGHLGSVWLVGVDEVMFDNHIVRYAHTLRHYHKPTVEYVLRQFLGECESAMALGYEEVPQDVFDSWAAKLRLADDGEKQ